MLLSTPNTSDADAQTIGLASDDQLVPIHAIRNSRRIAIVSLVSPILFMTSLVTAAIVVMSARGGVVSALSFWAIAQCFVCSSLFLVSLREKSILFDRELYTVNSPMWRFTAVGLGVAWGLVPAIVVMVSASAGALVSGALMSGFILSSTLLLRALPRTATALLIAVCAGFFGYTIVRTDTWSTIISLVMLVYFSALVICTRWYFARFDKRLEDVESAFAETAQLQSVLEEVGESSATFIWRTDADLKLTDIGQFRQFGEGDGTDLIGRACIDVFAPSAERDLLAARLLRRSEVVALELQAAPTATGVESWWRLSARPLYENQRFLGYRGSATNITALKVSENRAAFLTEYDDLTGLMNRSSFYRALDMHLGSIEAQHAQSGILWIDLDNFKWINDTFGHAGGDEVLKSVARRLKDTCLPSDSVCRFGGDEFAVLTTGHGERDEMLAFVDRLTKTLAAPYSLELSEVQCSASVGFKQILPDERDASSLLKEADLALYSAKDSGRATWKEYSEEFKAKVRGQRELARDLAEAIGTEDLKLQFQPIVSGDTERVVGVEALLRWFHPTRGAVSPSEFIAIAENNGLIIELGDTVVSKAIEAASYLPPEIKVGINISPLQIHSSALLILIENKIAEFGVDPQRLELEITETVFLSDNEFVLERLRRLKQVGVQIALDDFGTGFSSLAYLQRFPFDKLKLDQAFVRGIETSDQSCAIARATISMAHALGLRVTAEGVETRPQADFLKTQGCDELQGFLFSQPQTSAALEQFLNEQSQQLPPHLVSDMGKIVHIGKKG